MRQICNLNFPILMDQRGATDKLNIYNLHEKFPFERWYQAAVFQPFLRGHAHLDSKRREPWMYSAGRNIVASRLEEKRAQNVLCRWEIVLPRHKYVAGIW